MLKPAQLYREQLKIKFWEIAYSEKYMFVNDGIFEDINIPTTTEYAHDLVSVDKNNNVIGYIRYTTDKKSNVARSFMAINFTDRLEYVSDLLQAIDDLFCKYNYHKMTYGVFIGNPVEKTYDKLTKLYGGRVIGVSYDNCKLQDGRYYNHKSYELFREKYIKNRPKRFKGK